MDALIATKHILRKIDQCIDFSFIKTLTAKKYCLNNGKTSIDPEIFFRLMMGPCGKTPNKSCNLYNNAFTKTSRKTLNGIAGVSIRIEVLIVELTRLSY